MEILFGLLSVVFTAIPFVVAILFGFFGIWLVVALSQRPLWGAWTMAVAFLV